MPNRSRHRAQAIGLAVAALLLAPRPANAAPNPGGPNPATANPGGPSPASPNPAGPQPVGPARAAENPRLQTLLDELVDRGGTGVLAVVTNGSQTWYQASGLARRSSPDALTTAARFRAGSLTKSFVATVALQLVAEGRLRLSDTVGRWLPGLLPNGSAVTLRMLLNHSSGLYDYAEDQVLAQWIYTQPTIGIAPRRLIDIATSYPPLFDPGQGWYYSNTGYIVVGLILEAATRRSVHALVQERILTRLGLSGTSFPAHDRDIAGYHAHGYRPPDGAGTGWQDVTLLAPSLLWTAGGIISTAEDLRRFYGALLGGELLPAAQLAQLLTTIPVNPVFGYGLGIEALRGACGPVWGHSGGVPGYVTLAYSSRDGRRGVVLMLSTEPDENLIALLRLTVETAVCQMFDRVPPDLAARAGGSAGWAPGWGVRPVQ